MLKRAHDVLSKAVLHVDATAPLSDTLLEDLRQRASHVAVVSDGQCLGVWNVNNIDFPSDHATFQDLVEGQSCVSVSDEASVEEIGRTFADPDVGTRVVHNDLGEFVGVVTQQSLLEFLLRERQQPEESHCPSNTSEHDRAESLLAGEKRILEIISKSSSRDGGLTELVEFVEAQSDGAICSILLMDASGTHLRIGAANSLPDDFVRAIDGLEIGPNAGACGTAAFLDHPVIVSDIASDPLCRKIRDLALSHELRACWSSPIHSSSGKVLGTIAMYFKRPQSPDACHETLIDRALDLAAIAIERKSAEDGLIRSAQRLRRAQEIARVGSYELTGDGSPTFWSEECFRIVGLEPDSTIPSRKQFLEQIIHPDDRSFSQTTVSQALNNRERYSYEYRVLHPDGSIRWVHSRGEPICDATGRVVSIEGTLLDITGRKKAEKALRASETRSRALLEGSPVCTKIVDLDSRLQYMSAAGQQQLKICDVKPFYGSIFPPELYPESWRAPVTERLERAKAGEISSLECPVLDTDGSEVWYDTTFVPARDETGRIQHVIVTSVNITERKRAEEEARKYRDELAHVSRVSTMGEMATGIAHELNQPLAAIVSYSYAAKAIVERLHSDSREVQEILAKLGDQAIRAGDIVRQLRSFVTKTESARVRANLNTLVRNVARFVEPDIRHADTTLKLTFDEASPDVLVDEVQIQQVLVNLIRNSLDALQETPIGQREVAVSTRTQPDGQAEVIVSDSGTGLDQDELEKAFDAFFSTRQQGMGMGLPISRSIVEAHGGKLWSKSNIGPGATFGFSIPPADCHVPDGNPIVFIVDDESVMRDALGLVVQNMGLSVKCFPSAVDFLDVIESYDLSCPACLIADAQMPKITGIELLQRLNTLDKKLPFIMVTGHGSTALKNRANELGAVAYLEKPFPPSEIQQIIAANLKPDVVKGTLH